MSAQNWHVMMQSGDGDADSEASWVLPRSAGVMYDVQRSAADSVVVEEHFYIRSSAGSEVSWAAVSAAQCSVPHSASSGVGADRFYIGSDGTTSECSWARTAEDSELGCDFRCSRDPVCPWCPHELKRHAVHHCVHCKQDFHGPCYRLHLESCAGRAEETCRGCAKPLYESEFCVQCDNRFCHTCFSEHLLGPFCIFAHQSKAGEETHHSQEGEGSISSSAFQAPATSISSSAFQAPATSRKPAGSNEASGSGAGSSGVQHGEVSEAVCKACDGGHYSEAGEAQEEHVQCSQEPGKLRSSVQNSKNYHIEFKHLIDIDVILCSIGGSGEKFSFSSILNWCTVGELLEEMSIRLSTPAVPLTRSDLMFVWADDEKSHMPEISRWMDYNFEYKEGQTRSAFRVHLWQTAEWWMSSHADAWLHKDTEQDAVYWQAIRERKQKAMQRGTKLQAVAEESLPDRDADGNCTQQ